MLIEYIGRKDRKEDNIAGTSTVWLGHGDVQEVADEGAARRLLAYDTVWRRAGVDAGLGSVAKPATESPVGESIPADEVPRFVLDGPTGAVVLDAMDDAAVKSWVAENLEPHGIKVDGRQKGDKLKAAVIDAVKAATSGG